MGKGRPQVERSTYRATRGLAAVWLPLSLILRPEAPFRNLIQSHFGLADPGCWSLVLFSASLFGEATAGEMTVRAGERRELPRRFKKK